MVIESQDIFSAAYCRSYKSSLTTLLRKQARVFSQLHYVWLHHLANFVVQWECKVHQNFPSCTKVGLPCAKGVGSKLWNRQVKIELGR